MLSLFLLRLENRLLECMSLFHSRCLEGVSLLFVVGWCFLRRLLLDCGLQTFSVFPLPIQLFLHKIASIFLYLVPHELSKILGIIWKDICVLIRLGKMCECNPLVECIPVYLHVWLLDIITKDIWQRVGRHNDWNILPPLLGMLVLGLTDVSLSLKEQFGVIVLSLIIEKGGCCSFIYDDKLWSLLNFVIIQVKS